MTGRRILSATLLLLIIISMISAPPAESYTQADLERAFQILLSLYQTPPAPEIPYEKAQKIYSNISTCLPEPAKQYAENLAQALSNPNPDQAQITHDLASLLPAILQSLEDLPGTAEQCGATDVYLGILILLMYKPGNNSFIPSNIGAMGPETLSSTERMLLTTLSVRGIDYQFAHRALEYLLNDQKNYYARASMIAILLTLLMGPYPTSQIRELANTAITLDSKYAAITLAVTSSGDYCHLLDTMVSSIAFTPAIRDIPTARLALYKLLYTGCASSIVLASYVQTVFWAAETLGYDPGQIGVPTHPVGGLDIAILGKFLLENGRLLPKPPAMLPGATSSFITRQVSDYVYNFLDSLPSSEYRLYSAVIGVLHYAANKRHMNGIASAINIYVESFNIDAREARTLLNATLILEASGLGVPLRPTTVYRMLSTAGMTPAISSCDMVDNYFGPLDRATALYIVACKQYEATIQYTNIGPITWQLQNITGTTPPPPSRSLSTYISYLEPVIGNLTWFDQIRAVDLASVLYAYDPDLNGYSYPLADTAQTIMVNVLNISMQPPPGTTPPTQNNTDQELENQTSQLVSILGQLDPETLLRIASILQNQSQGDPLAEQLADLLVRYAETGDARYLVNTSNMLHENPSLVQDLLEAIQKQSQTGEGMPGTVDQVDPTDIAETIRDLVDSGRTGDARNILDSLDPNLRDKVLDILGNEDPEIIDKIRQPINPPGLEEPDLGGLNPPNLNAPSMSINMPGLGPWLLLPLGLLALVLVYLSRNSITSAVTRRRLASKANKVLRELRSTPPGDAREQVIRLYERVLEMLQPVRRRMPWWTHREYGMKLPGNISETYWDPALIYEKAKFSSQPVTSRDVEQMKQAIQRLAEMLARGGEEK